MCDFINHNKRTECEAARFQGERGNVLWIILVAVALLGALTFTLSRSGSTSSQSGNFEKERIQISKLLRFAKSVEVAVQQLKLNGCSENDLSFWHDSNGDGVEDGSDDYRNVRSPDDRSCHIFDVNGGGLTWTTFPESLFDEQWDSSRANYATPLYVGFFEVKGVGRDCSAAGCSDLVLTVPDLKLSVCKQINRMFSIGEPAVEGMTNYSPYNNVNNPAKFRGIFNFINEGSIIGDQMTDLDGETAGCFLSQPGGNNIPTFYHVLLAR